MKTLAMYVAAFLLAVITTGLAASVFSTQFVLAGLESTGVDVPLAERVRMTVLDLRILILYSMLIAAFFLPAFLVAGLCAGRLPGSRRAWFAPAGASAIVIGLKLMEYSLGGMMVAGARSPAGLVFQGLAGALGGWCFAQLTTRWVGRKQ